MKLKTTLLFILISCSFSCHFFKEENQEKNNTNTPKEPAKLALFLKLKKDFLTQNQEIVLIEKTNYSKLFWDFFDQTITPNQCATDINNDQILDYAFLINQKNELKIVIAQSNKKSYSFWMAPFTLQKITPTGIQYSLSPQPAGQTDVIKKQPETLILKKNAFVIKNLEQDIKILYDENGKIQLFDLL
ncbi:MAG: hypothetical protein QG594_1505 [Bacteroidota bacterium]|nr:hypothetical protein [Bacteroidota bacterium]